MNPSKGFVPTVNPLTAAKGCGGGRPRPVTGGRVGAASWLCQSDEAGRAARGVDRDADLGRSQGGDFDALGRPIPSEPMSGASIQNESVQRAPSQV